MTSRADYYRAVSTRLLQECFKPQLERLIKEQPDTQKLTATELARRIGYTTVSGLHAVMNGRAQPPLHVLVGLAVELRLHSIEELFGDFGSASAVIEQRTE